MKKKAIFIFIFVFAIFFIFIFALQNNIFHNKVIDDKKIEYNGMNINKEESIEVSSNNEKTTPNTIIVFEKEYSVCGHIISSRATIPEEMVNMTKEEIVNQYPNWSLEDFSKEVVTLSKKVEGFCGEHYILTEENGKIYVYRENQEGKRSMQKKTDIQTNYLPETDRINLRNGIRVYGVDNLNKTLEDFEI